VSSDDYRSFGIRKRRKEEKKKRRKEEKKKGRPRGGRGGLYRWPDQGGERSTDLPRAQLPVDHSGELPGPSGDE
jgi:hypothetical protein